MSRFTKATKRQSKARVALIGPSGSGKTYTALLMASSLGQRVALIDTERGSASKYAGIACDFDTLDLDNHDPRAYVEAISEAAREGYDVLVIDSLSHAWNGRGGALEQVDKAAARGRGASGNSFGAWREVTPMHNALVDAILTYPGHVIATLRAKTEYVLENINGKQVPRKVGMAPIQRDGLEYEFDVCADMDHDHTLVVTKSRCPALADTVVHRPTVALGTTLRAWLDDGDEALPMQHRTALGSAYSSEEAARSNAQVAAGATKGATKSPGQVLADGLVNDFVAQAQDLDSLRTWLAANVAAVIALGQRGVAYTLRRLSKHAVETIEDMNEAGFDDEWAIAKAIIAPPAIEGDSNDAGAQ